MSFKLALAPTFWATVRTELPAEKESSKPILAVIQVEYKRLGIEELQELRDRATGDGDLTDDIKLCREVMVGWKDVIGRDDEPLEFNDRNRDQLLDAGFAGSIGIAFFKNQPKAKEKN